MSLLLTPLQYSWLQELQVPAPLLSPYLEPPKAKAVPTPVPMVKALLKPMPEPEAEPEPITVSLVQVDKAALSTMSLADLEVYAKQCQGCELHAQRINPVWGAGQTQQPEWMVISAAPSSHEELAALPMQGPSGELFAAQMRSIGIDSEQQLYITQLVKCRPTDRQDHAHYVAACQAILLRQIELIQPQRLVLLGDEVVALFFGADKTVPALRSEWHEWQGLPVVVSHHPASMLLRPQLKAEAWADLLLMRSGLHAS